MSAKQSTTKPQAVFCSAPVKYRIQGLAVHTIARMVFYLSDVKLPLVSGHDNKPVPRHHNSYMPSNQ